MLELTAVLLAVISLGVLLGNRERSQSSGSAAESEADSSAEPAASWRSTEEPLMAAAASLVRPMGHACFLYSGAAQAAHILECTG